MSRFNYTLGFFKSQSFGQVVLNNFSPDVECFVNAQASTFQKELNNITGSIQLSPVKSVVRNGCRKTISVIPECRGIEPRNCDVLIDSGAFSDVLSGDRVTPELALLSGGTHSAFDRG